MLGCITDCDEAGAESDGTRHGGVLPFPDGASQVIGQLSPVGMMVASVLVLKEKMRRLSSQQILLFLYALCTIALLPLTVPSKVPELSDWQAAQVCALITLTPLFSDLLSMVWPYVFTRPMLNLIGYLGAFVVVAGAMYSAIGHRLWRGLRKREAVVPLPRSGE